MPNVRGRRGVVRRGVFRPIRQSFGSRIRIPIHMRARPYFIYDNSIYSHHLMASAAPGPKGMTLLINTVDKSIHSLKYGSLALDQPHTREQSRQQNSMYPGIPSNPFVVGEDDHDEHEYVDETIVSPLSPARRKSAWHPDTWSPDRFSRGHEYDAEAHGHAHSPYTSEDVEDPSKSVHFNRVKWENEREGHQPKSTISSAEEFQLPRSREVDDGLGIHITDGAGGEVMLPDIYHISDCSCL